jgi:hypothetical protein
VTHHKGASLLQRGYAAGTRKASAFGKRTPSSRPPSSNQYAVSDGRFAVGVVTVSARGFTAITTGGVVIGEFATLREAARVLPNGGGA